MAIDGNLQVGQTLSLADPVILVNGVELTGGVQKQDERLRYYRGNHIYYATSGPVNITFTHPDPDVHIVYTFNGRTPVSKQLAKPTYLVTEHFVASGKYDPSHPIHLYQNTSGDNTVIKVRAFHDLNPNICSKIIKAHITVVGGNTKSDPKN